MSSKAKPLSKIKEVKKKEEQSGIEVEIKELK